MIPISAGEGEATPVVGGGLLLARLRLLLEVAKIGSGRFDRGGR